MTDDEPLDETPTFDGKVFCAYCAKEIGTEGHALVLHNRELRYRVCEQSECLHQYNEELAERTLTNAQLKAQKQRARYQRERSERIHTLWRVTQEQDGRCAVCGNCRPLELDTVSLAAVCRRCHTALGTLDGVPVENIVAFYEKYRR